MPPSHSNRTWRQPHLSRPTYTNDATDSSLYTPASVSETRAAPAVAVVLEPQNGLRIDRAMGELFPEHSRSALARLIEEGNATVDGKPVLKPSSRVETGQTIVLNVPAATASPLVSQDLPINVLYEDDDLIVLDKPPGVVVHPAAGHADGTVVNALLFHVKDLSGIGGELRPGIVHRLDKDTSGVLLVAKHDESHRKLTSAWHDESFRKEYVAIVYGTPSNDRGTVDAPIGRDPRDRKKMSVVEGGRASATEYVVAERLRHACLLRLRLRSGRTHQIRVHMKHLGHPLIGDPVYSGPQWKGIPDRKLQRIIADFSRQALHAARLTFVHPRSGASMTVEAPLPADMQTLLAALRTV
jgi:23S rRNA pseudouridine1911/1915/1917 synthase